MEQNYKGGKKDGFRISWRGGEKIYIDDKGKIVNIK